ncbi:uncharacterized protein LOC135813652 [Sycon ciliatum]|uniref:uncharacterized protein LOC135813652 n=1 Tax=Sycon ciliatum TaxID=27933 RepID=UPI0031F710B4
MAMAVVFAFLAFASVSPIFAQQPVKEADAAIGDGEFRMIVDASTGHDPTKSEVDQWLAGGEPNQAPIGSLENPFKQIQTCVNVQHQLCLQWSLSRSTGGRFGTGPPTDDDSNGDGGHGWQTDGWQQSHHICAVRTGTYRESVSVSDWPEQCSLRVEAYNNELVTTVLVKGTADISNLTWQPYKGSIMMASLPDEFIAQHPEPFQQIFHNEVMMMEARWPNAKLEDMLSPTAWSRTEKGSVYGRIEDKDLYAAGVDWTGALATLNVAHQFYTWTRYVQSYSRDAAAKSASFTYPRDLPGITSWATRANATAAWTGHQYFLSGKLDALDR